LSDTTSPSRRSSRQSRLFIAIGAAIAVVAIVVVSILTGGRVTNGPNGQPTSKLVGESVASFSLSGLQSGTVEAPWKSHHAAVLIFFASWCTPCKAEMPKVASYLRHHNEGTIRVVGIDANDERSAAKSFVATSGVTFPIAFDPDGSVTSGIFNFRTVPETAFVNAKGVVTQVYFGAIPKNVLVTGIAALRKTLHAA
jgi:thiol-disulfide isomerase/thioredoxin